MTEWKYGPPDTKYARWYRVEAQYNWKGRKPFTRCVYAKWIPKTKEWVAYNNHRLTILRWMNCGDMEIE